MRVLLKGKFMFTGPDCRAIAIPEIRLHIKRKVTRHPKRRTRQAVRPCLGGGWRGADRSSNGSAVWEVLSGSIMVVAPCVIRPIGHKKGYQYIIDRAT